MSTQKQDLFFKNKKKEKICKLLLQKKKIGDRFIIVDEFLSTEKRKEIQELDWIGDPVQFLDDNQLSQELDKLLEKELGGATLIIFPGSGAQYPRKKLKIDGLPNQTVFAKRLWIPGKNPVCLAGDIKIQGFLNLQVKKIIVVDDVISSGGTISALHKRNSWRFPLATWVAATWVSQTLPKGLKGFRILSACQVVKSSGLKSAINSLSTLRADKDLSLNYALRHLRSVESQERFINLLEH